MKNREGTKAVHFRPKPREQFPTQIVFMCTLTSERKNNRERACVPENRRTILSERGDPVKMGRPGALGGNSLFEELEGFTAVIWRGQARASPFTQGLMPEPI